MSKFKVGDKVLRTVGDFGFVREGDVCLVTGLRRDGQLEIGGDDSRCHTPSNFELYVEEDVTKTLTPLQAAEAFLNGEDLLYLNYLGNWVDAGKSLHYSLDFLSKEKFKLKPKTIVINGVEVPAPLPVGKAPHGVYSVDIDSKPYESYIGEIPEGRYFWATQEDAQAVLDAMLIPFNRT